MLISKFIDSLKQEGTLIKNSTFLVICGVMSGLIATIFSIFFSRFFGPTYFGIYKSAIAIASTAAFFLDLGIKYLLPRYIAEFENKNQPHNIADIIEKTFAFKGFLAIFVLLSFWLMGPKIALIFFHSQDQTTLIWPIMIVFTVIFFDITAPILLGFQNFKLLAISTLLIPIMHLIIAIPLSLAFGIKGALIGTALAFIAGNIPAIKYILSKKLRTKRIKTFAFKVALKEYSIPAYLASVPTYVTILIIPLLSIFYQQRIIGFYSFSLSFYIAAQLVPICLASVMFPRIAELNGRKKYIEALETFKRLNIIYTPFVIIGSLAIIVLAHPIVKYLVPDFLPAVNMIKAQTISALILGYFAIAVNYAIASKKLKMASYLNWIVSITFVILSFFVINLAK